MTKTKSTYVCQSCGAVHVRWMGRCPVCGEWNTIVEEGDAVGEGAHVRPSYGNASEPIPITDNGQTAPRRLSTGLGECDRVLGGGVVPGSVTLIGGDPGIGKSTLMLQIGHHLARSEGKVLYVSGEESFNQTRLRAARLGTLTDGLLLLPETQLQTIRNHMTSGAYQLVIVDSIQSVYSSELAAVPGSISQVRDCANEFLRIGKGEDVPVFLVGHVTKEGAIAGPRMLEHLVDAVLYFEGEGKQALRILRGVKNRFGSTNEIGVFEMTENGLREVPNPSALFLDERPKGVSGSVVFPSIEGTRPLLVEVQALVGETSLASPRRTVNGVNPNRVSLVLAVLEKRTGLHVSDKDVFVNVAGGVRLEETAADLAIAVALVSSLREVPAMPALAVFGEVGLAGEIRAVDRARQRIAEASKFGFSQCIVPRGCIADLKHGVADVMPAGSIGQAIELALEQ
jgi:DNA repair protein RadA/Sms